MEDISSREIDALIEEALQVQIEVLRIYVPGQEQTFSQKFDSDYFPTE